MDPNKLPKQFCENINVGLTKEFFVMALTSGNSVTPFALTPEHTKRFSELLAHNIKEYEQKYGAIKASWAPGVKSPLQIDNIDNPGGEKNK